MRFSPDGQLLVWMYDIDTINAADPARSSVFYVVPKGRRRAATGPDEPRHASTNLTPFDWWSDNRHVVVALPDASGGNRHLWMADTESGNDAAITVGHTNETAPAVSPTGATDRLRVGRGRFRSRR